MLTRNPQENLAARSNIGTEFRKILAHLAQRVGPQKQHIQKRHQVSVSAGPLKVRCVAAGPLLPVVRDGDTRRTDKQAGSHQVVCKHRGDVVLLYRVRLRYQDGTSCRTRIFDKCAGV